MRRNGGEERSRSELDKHSVTEGTHHEGDGKQAERKREENGEEIFLEGNVERKSKLAGKCHKIFFEVAPGGQKIDSEKPIADTK